VEGKTEETRPAGVSKSQAGTMENKKVQTFPQQQKEKKEEKFGRTGIAVPGPTETSPPVGGKQPSGKEWRGPPCPEEKGSLICLGGKKNLGGKK